MLSIMQNDLIDDFEIHQSTHMMLEGLKVGFGMMSLSRL